MFEKNLNDLVRGLRNNKNNEAKFVTECLDEIKQELRQENMALKANAVLKLSYIQMLGYDISWAAFNIIEVMSSPKFIHKRIAYMTASQCFHSDLDVLMLATNLIKKDMNSQNQYDSGSAMVGLSCFVSPDLARDLANDIMSMMVSSKPYVRKRAILLMYKVFLNFPEALRPAFPRLKERLEDPDQGVQCAAVNVICELARKNPKNYLALAPLFFKLMTTSSNNWMLIKIIKLFGALCPLEPRLGKKLLEPLTSLIHRSASNIKKCRQEREFVKAAKKMLDVKSTHTKADTSYNGSPSNSPLHKPNGLNYCVTGISTSAMSLLYECINTVIAGLPDHQASMQLCVSKLRLLIEDQDQNLKYLGLLLLNKILKAQPKIVIGHKDLILQCLDDRDESIRYRALDLIVGMISKKTLMDIIKKLMVHMEKAEGSLYRDELLAKIIEMCSQSNFQFITNFEWYIDVLLQLSGVEGTKHGRLIANQMLDVAIRVKAVRKYAVPVFSSLLAKPSLISSTNEKNTSAEVLFAAAWVAGEYAEFLTDIHVTVSNLCNPKVTSLPSHIQCVYIQAIGKLFSRVLSKVESEEGGDEEEINSMSESLIAALPVFTYSADLEVQDRSCCVLQLIKLVMKMKKEGLQCAADVKALFAEELLPVAPKAQKKVPIPEGLDLDKWINEPLSEDESDEEELKPYFMDGASSGPLGSVAPGQKEKYYEPDEEELERAREIRKMFQESNPHYLKGSTTNKKTEDSSANNDQTNDVNNIPVKELDLSVSLKLHGHKEKKGKRKGKKGKKGRQASESEDDPPGPSYEIAPVIDLAGDEVGEAEASADDPHSALNIDLDTPLGADEVLPVQTHRVVTEKSPEPSKDTKKSKKSKKKDGKKHAKTKDGENEKDDRQKKSSKKVKKRTSSTTSANKKKTPREETEAERKATLLKLASQVSSEQSKSSAATVTEDGDDMEFWLTPASQTPPIDENSVVKSTPQTVNQSTALDDKENEVATKQKKPKKKSKKEKAEKEKKKKRKKVSEDTPQPPMKDTPLDNSEMMIMDVEDKPQDLYSRYKELCKDNNIRLLYDIRCNPLQNTQLICSTIFQNLTGNHIQKLEFNVLDSLNMKLTRQVGAKSHDPVLVPFQLLPEMTNEGQFAFTFESVVMSQSLRGTLTYILKEKDGSSTSEKVDFRLTFPVSSFFYSRPISSDEFTSLLASGEVKEKQSIKVDIEKSLDDVTSLVCNLLKLRVVEKVDGGVSLYGETVQKHALCLLLKKMDGNSISVDGKADNFQLLSSAMKEIQSVLDD